VELRQLEHFLAVAEHGGFTKAAHHLHYGQSALSVSIQALERELGVRLFDRTTHRVVLTDAGALLMPPARRALASVEDARDIAAAVRGALRGTLRIGIMQSFGLLDIPAVLGRFHQAHPDVDLQIRPAAGGSAALVDELRKGSLDMAFVALADADPSIEVVPLAREGLLMAGNADLMPAGRGAVALEALADSSFVDFPPGWGIRTAVDRAFAAAGVARRVTMEIADLNTYLRLIGAGLGIGLVAPSFSGQQPKLRTRPTRPAVSWHVVMATPAGRTPSFAARALAEMVEETVSAQR
jgi:DNA-binding transcriptional LysR family regulator